MGDVYDMRNAANLHDRPPARPQPVAEHARRVPVTTLQMVATLLDQAQTRTLHSEEVRRACALLLAPDHPSHRRRI